MFTPYSKSMKQISIRLYNKGKIKKLRSNKFIRRILSTVASSNWEKAYVKASYGKQLDIHGNLVMFYNDAYITDKKELQEVIKIFWNEA